MPIGPFAEIPITRPPQKVRLEHINELRRALTNIQDAYDVAVAVYGESVVGTRANWLQSLVGPPGAGVVPKGSVATVADLDAIVNPAVDDVYTVDADGHAYAWDGSAWVDIGAFRGPPGDLVKAVADTYYAAKAATEAALGRVAPAASPTVSQSLRATPTGPYWAPSAAVMPQDFGAVSSASTSTAAANSDAFDGAIAQAKAEGTTILGKPVLLPPGRYLIARPIVLPRSGANVQGIVHLVGDSPRTTAIEGVAGFPAAAGLIEWEAAPLRAYMQRIAGLRLVMPPVADTKAIRYVKQATGTTYADYDTERLQIQLENLLIEGSNQYHLDAIYLDAAVFYSLFRNLWLDPAPYQTGNHLGGYSTRLLTTSYQLQGQTPYHTNDQPGIAYSRMESLFANMRRGGLATLFKGRLFRVTWDTGFSNSGAPGDVDVQLLNCSGSTIRNVGIEGKGARMFTFTNCHSVVLENPNIGTQEPIYPAWKPATAYAAGDHVVRSTLLTSATGSKGYFTATVAGTSGATEPSWPTSSGTVTDGTVTWSYSGAALNDAVAITTSDFVTIRDRMSSALAPDYTTRGIKLIRINPGSRHTRLTNFQIKKPDGGALADEYVDGGTNSTIDVVEATGIGSIGGAG